MWKYFHSPLVLSGPCSPGRKTPWVLSMWEMLHLLLPFYVKMGERTGVKCHEVTECGKACSCSSPLPEHVRAHTGRTPCGCSGIGTPSVEVKLYDCKECRKVFRCPLNLQAQGRKDPPWQETEQKRLRIPSFFP